MLRSTQSGEISKRVTRRLKGGRIKIRRRNAGPGWTKKKAKAQ